VTTFSTIEEERAQVAQIISLVNRKSAEIKNRLVKPTDLAAEEELEISIEDEDRPTEEHPANKEQLADAVAE
jgi:orotate phosphoribosyltransferase